MKVNYSDAFMQMSNEYMTRRVLAHHNNIMLVQMTMHKYSGEPGMHSHPHEQIIYVQKGKLELIVDGKNMVLSEGDSVYVEPNVPHGAIVLEDESILLDIFTPRRDDFLKKAD